MRKLYKVYYIYMDAYLISSHVEDLKLYIEYFIKRRGYYIEDTESPIDIDKYPHLKKQFKDIKPTDKFVINYIGKYKYSEIMKKDDGNFYIVLVYKVLKDKRVLLVREDERGIDKDFIELNEKETQKILKDIDEFSIKYKVSEVSI